MRLPLGECVSRAPMCRLPSAVRRECPFYTGRYMSSHGSTYNGVPLRVGEMTIGDHLRPLGFRVALVGKTHMAADMAGFKRLGIRPDSIEGVFAAECGFEPVERDDGLWPDGAVPPDLRYNEYLRAHGYSGNNPWHDYANAASGPDGERKSGWLMRYAREPARVKEEDFGNSLYDRPRHGVHCASGHAAVVFASFLYQAPLALHRARSLSRPVRRRRRDTAQSK